MTLSKEKQALLALSDEEIKKVLNHTNLIRNLEQQEKRLKTTEGNAYSQLQELIGLAEVKRTIDNIIALKRLQKIAKMRGRTIESPSLHIQMVGGPGTAKTTVARLLPSIFKEAGICSKGTFIEAGRADLISDHVGGTAPLTREMCRKAKGGILFIDEAYSFVDEGNSYMGEFISTLIAEMENNRDDLMVIFAGYEDKMRDFMSSNPGLESRTAFKLHFPDYTTAELLAIARHIADKKGFNIAESADEKLLRMFELAQQAERFGNARYVRNQVEHAIMTKAQRIHYRDSLQLTDEQLFTLNAEDFLSNDTVSHKSPNVRRIGFIA